MVPARGQIDGQSARLDAEEILIERLGLKGVEGTPDPGVLQTIAASLAVERRWRDRRETLHHGAGVRAEVERMKPLETHAETGESSRSRRRLSR